MKTKKVEHGSSLLCKSLKFKIFKFHKVV